MFSFLKKPPVETTASALPPQPSNKERIAKVVKDANEHLVTITATVEKRKAERKEIQTKLSAVSTRASELKDAITYSESMMNIAPTQEAKDKVKDLALIATGELEEVQAEQQSLRDELTTVNSFLEDAVSQVAKLKAHVANLEADFNSLDIREAEALVRRDMGQIDNIVHDYRREVFTIEAHAELAQG